MSPEFNNLPLVFCIGAQKAGTTWLYSYFRQHPNVHVPAEKEVHYFDSLHFGNNTATVRQRRAQLAALKSSFARRVKHDLRAGFESVFAMHQFGICSFSELELLVRMHDGDGADHAAYTKFLSRRYRGEDVVVDVTPGYQILQTSDFEEMLRAFPNAKFVFVMREPVDRVISSMRMNYTKLRASEPGLTFDMFAAEVMSGKRGLRDYLVRSRYPATIRAVEAAACGERILYMFYEDMFSDDSLRKLCAFLDIPMKSGEYQAIVHRGDAPGSENAELVAFLQGKLAGVYPQMIKKFGNALPEAWNKAFANLNHAPDGRRTAKQGM